MIDIQPMQAAPFDGDGAPLPAPLIPRGVYMTPWFYRGRRWLFVVDHTHSVLHLEPVIDYGDRDAQVQALRVMLQALDPLGLALVD